MQTRNTGTTPRLKAQVRERTLLHDGFLRVYRYVFEVERHEGGVDVLKRELMERGDAVAVLGYDPARDEVVLGNEFRPGVQATGEYPYRDNLIAGAIDRDESAVDAAVREMREEAGLELREPRVIHPGAFVSSGGTSERIALVFGLLDTTHAGGVHGNSDEQEDILAVVLPASMFVDRVRSGEINDMKTLVAGYWFAEHRSLITRQPLESRGPHAAKREPL
jgi:ADP-ribose pyrophosphatase